MDRHGSDGTRIRDFLASVVDLTDVYELEAQKNLAVFCSPGGDSACHCLVSSQYRTVVGIVSLSCTETRHEHRSRRGAAPSDILKPLLDLLVFR